MDIWAHLCEGCGNCGTLDTEYGVIHIELVPKCPPRSVAYILDLLRLHHCVGCRFYFAEKIQRFVVIESISEMANQPRRSNGINNNVGMSSNHSTSTNTNIATMAQ